MKTLGLGTAEFSKYLLLCASSHSVELAVELRNNAGETLVSFDQGRGGGRDVTVTDGQVDVDATSSAGRFLSLTVADPAKHLSVAAGANFTNRMLHVSRGRYVPALGRTVWAEIFTGPIVLAPRSGDVVQFTAHGKARFAMHGQRDLYTIKAGTPKTTAIKQMLNVLAGEPMSNMGGIPDLASKLRKDITLQIDQYPLAACRALADSLVRHLFCDGAGDWQLPRIDSPHTVYTFSDAKLEPGMVATPPEASTDWLSVKNAVEVTGGVRGTNPPPVAKVFADPSNPFSAQTEGRNGAAAYRWDRVSVPTAMGQKLVDTIAKNTLQRDLAAVRSIKWESLPMDIFDEMDYVSIETPELTAQVRLAKFTIPLNLESSPSMSYGYTSRRSSNVFAGRR